MARKTKKQKEEERALARELTIPVSIAIGAKETDTTLEFSRKWIAWSNEYPQEKSTLSPALTGPLDAMAGTVVVYDTVVSVIETVKTAVTTAKQAYDAAQAVVPGLGAAAGAKLAAEQALQILKLQIQNLGEKIVEMPSNLIEVLTNTRVDRNATMPVPPEVPEN